MSNSASFFRKLLLGTLGFISISPSLLAGKIYLSNASFESPSTAYVDIDFAGWQKTPQPSYWDDSGGFYWVQTTGIFLNTSPTNSDHINNCDGSQAAYVFADPGVGLFQDNISVDSFGASNTFNAVFSVGKGYHLVMGVIGGDSGMMPGASMELGLYYRDSSNNMVTIVATNIVYNPTNFPDINNLIDCAVDLPVVKAGDAWAGKNIGVEILSTTGFNLAGGDWVIDNVRLNESIYVPGYSFETPTTVYAAPDMDYWQKAPQPSYYDATGGFLWIQLMGEFLNTPTNSTSDHIYNCDGLQAAYLFADPDVAIFQDYQSIYGTNTSPKYDFNAKYEAGKAYNLTIGLICEQMQAGVLFGLSLYYRDASNNMVTIAATNIPYNSTVFSNINYFTDCTLHLPTVKATDAWAGKNIGIQLASGATFSNAGGDWDVDNVRLIDVVDPVLGNPAVTNQQFSLTFTGEPGTHFELLTTTNLLITTSNWTSLGTYTNVTGTVALNDANPISKQHYYRAHLLP